MKKFMALGFALFIGGSFLLTDSTQAQSSSSYGSYWDFYRSYYSGENARSSSRYAPRYRSPSYRSTSNRRTSNYRSYPTRSNRSSNYRTYSTRNTRAQSSNALRVTATPIRLRQDINEITNAPVDLFQLGLSYPGGGSNVFTPAAQIRSMQFQIVDNTGVVSDFSDFDLVIEDQDFEFEANGYVTLQFGNLRLARGESRALNVKIRLNDPDTFARQSGSFRVKLTDVAATQEGGVQGVEATIGGRTVSDYVVLNPRPSTSGGVANGTASSTPIKIFGRALGAGEKAPVLSAKLEASRDDFIVEQVTVRNTFGNNVDGLIKEVRLVNQNTGRVLSSRRFANGEVTFNLNNTNQIYIARNTSVTLVFEVVVASNLPNSTADNRLELTFAPADIEIFGIGSGQNVPDSSKSFNVDAETFTINDGGGGGSSAVASISFSSTQPAFVSNGNLDQIVRFQVRNNGSRAMALGRLSLQVNPSGVEFPGGQSLDDAALVRVVNGFQEFGSGFTTTSATGNVFRFDTSSEVTLSPGEVQEYALQLKLDNVGSNEDSDAVSVRILGDSGFTRGTLANIRSSGANFAWSDRSASPHSVNSNDWLSGFLFPGLPTGNFVKRRQ